VFAVFGGYVNVCGTDHLSGLSGNTFIGP